jgi:hypothetical protein
MYDLKIENNNYLLGSLWPYLLGLSEAPNTLGYVGCNPHGQKRSTRQNPNWKVVLGFSWLVTVVGDWYVGDGREFKKSEFPFHAINF